MKFLRAICFGLALVFCVSCAHFESNLSPTAKPDQESAILYGRFYLKPTLSTGLRIALWLQNVDTLQSVYIPFNKSEPFCAIQIKPGKYQAAGFLAANSMHQILREQPFMQRDQVIQIARPFIAGPGSQTYLGDYTAEATLSRYIEQFQIEGITNNFKAATLEFRNKYPNLVTAPAASMFQLQGNDL
jgi:hypothetical protein